MSSEKGKAEFLKEATGVSESVCLAVLDANKGDANKAMEQILDMNTDPLVEARKEQTKEVKRQDKGSSSRKRPHRGGKRGQKDAKRAAEEDRERRLLEQERLLETQKEVERLAAVAADREAKQARLAEENRRQVEENRRLVEENRRLAEEKELAVALEKSKLSQKEEMRRMAAELEDAKEVEDLGGLDREEEDARLADDVFGRHVNIQKREQERKRHYTEVEQSVLDLKREAGEAPAGSAAHVEVLAKLEQATRDLEAVKEELEELKLRKEASEATATSGQPPVPPVVSIYVRNDTDEKTMKDHIAKAKALFVLKGVAEEEIRVMDVTHDVEFQSYLEERCGGTLPFPIIFVRNHPIGNADSLLKLDEEKGAIEKLLVPPPEDGEGGPAYTSELELGFLDQVLNVGESVVSGVSTVMWLPVTIVTWPFRGEAKEPEKGPNDVDFHIIHTNWYWRNLQRTFRFSDDGFFRIHPTHKDVRATHQYDTIERITYQDAKNIVIIYKDGSSPDYVRAVPSDIEKMVEIILTRSKSTILVNRVSSTAVPKAK